MGSIIVTSEKQKGEYLPLGRRTSVVGRDEGIHINMYYVSVHFHFWQKISLILQ
jgi:hypothetical protein